MSDLLSGLNEPQRAAVTLPAQHALILAGAGSGKTRVLTTRIAWLIANGQCAPRDLLAVTFTNKAAKEMLARLGAMLAINPRGMWVGTFHGLCNRMLRIHHREAGLPQLFQILDASDQLSALKRLLKSLDIDSESQPPRELCWFINAQKEAGLRPAAVAADDRRTLRRVELYEAYEQQCQKEGVVDFAELLLRCKELLQRNESLRRHYQERFRHILVDEFQDANRLQYQWLKLLCGDAGAMFCVGDDDQSIYAFRGADIGNMRDFEREMQVGNVIRLEQNYRSHGNILDAANAIILNNPQRLGKNLWTAAGAGEPLQRIAASSDLEEAQRIVSEAHKLLQEGAARADIAILYRSNAQSRLLEHALFAAGVAYRVHGGLRFFERAEIKHALAYLRLIANPDDDTAFTRVVNFPPRGVGARSMELLAAAAAAQGVSLHAAISAIGGGGGVRLAAFAALLAELRQAAQLPLPELVDHVLERSGLRQRYQGEREGQERLDNLDELVNAASLFVAEEGESDEAGELSADLAAFLAHAALEAGDHQADAGADAVQLMTVHAAKGLEFDVVFISGLEEGLFPHENALDDPCGLEEERRLMYVALTRARRRLYLCHAEVRMLHGQTRYNLPSRFVDEIPLQLICGDSAAATTSLAASHASAYASPRSPSPAKRPSRNGGGGLYIGQSVRHEKFGRGVIINAEGGGAQARVQINFDAVGVKWLALAVAKLEAEA